VREDVECRNPFGDANGMIVAEWCERDGVTKQQRDVRAAM
jgi:hypothetical protein